LAALDLSAPSTLPLVAWTATPGTANLVRLVTLPTSGQYQVIVHNRDRASKNLCLSTDQTLTDGGAAPANVFLSIDDHYMFTIGQNRASGIAPLTQLAFFSTTATAVNIEIMINEIR